MVAELKLEDFGSEWLRVAVAESVIKVSEIMGKKKEIT